MDENNAVITEHDHAEALKEEFDMEIQSEEFGFNCTLSIEDSTCEYQNKDHNDVSNEGKVNMSFHSHFSDDSAHNVDTTFYHMKKFMNFMYDNHLFINDGMTYDNIYGFRNNTDVQMQCGYYIYWGLHT